MTKSDYDNAVQKPALFEIGVEFEQGNNRNRWHILNQSWAEVRSFRETVFTHGFFLEHAPGRGEIIFPWDLRKIRIDVQRKGWNDGTPEVQFNIKSDNG